MTKLMQNVDYVHRRRALYNIITSLVVVAVGLSFSLYSAEMPFRYVCAQSCNPHGCYSGTLIGKTVILILESKKNKLVHGVFFLNFAS